MTDKSKCVASEVISRLKEFSDDLKAGVDISQKYRTTSFRQMTDAEREAQRQSFAYGNCKLANDGITRDIVRRASEELREKDISRAVGVRESG